MRKKQIQELRKLHKLIIHNHHKIIDDHKWYRLARRETRLIDKLSYRSPELNRVCRKCFAKRCV